MGGGCHSQLDSNEFKKGAGNVKDHLTWSERRKLAEDVKEEKSARFFKYAFSVPTIRYFNRPRHLFVPPIISNNRNHKLNLNHNHNHKSNNHNHNHNHNHNDQ